MIKIILITIFILSIVLVCYLENRANNLGLGNRQLCYGERIGLILVSLTAVIPKLLSENIEVLDLFQYSLIICILVVIAKIDFEEKIIPNDLVLMILIINMLFLILNLKNNIVDAQSILLTSLIGFAFGGGIFIVVNMLQKNSIGAGDIKLLAVIGISVGFYGIVSICLNAFVFTAITSLFLLRFKKVSRGGEIPLAPYIFLAVTLYG